MSYPKTKIVIGKDGSSRIEGLEKTDNCDRLFELAKKAGKIKSSEKIEHIPVQHDVQQRRS